MADFRIDDNDLQTLLKGFTDIKSSLDLNDAGMDFSTSNIGHGELVTALKNFNEQVSRTKNKYKKKTSNFIDFLKSADTGSEEIDKQLTDAIKVNEESKVSEESKVNMKPSGGGGMDSF